MPPATRHRSLALWLALVYAALVLYASLYPFEGWRWPPGMAPAQLLELPRAVHQSDFDIVSNLLGYAPLGLLVAVAALRSGWRVRWAAVATLLACTGLSYTCEMLQHLVPGRVPTREDVLMNAAGAAGGGLTAVVAHATGLVERWSRLRSRWFAGDGAFAMALLVLWPVGLLFPTPVPLGLGQVGERLRQGLAGAVEGVPWAEGAWQLLASPPPVLSPLRPLDEMLIVALGLLAPCLVAFTVVAAPLKRLVLAGGALALALATMTLSTALNFGPQHATSWIGPGTGPGLGLGVVGAALLAPLPRRVLAGLGLMVLTGLVLGMSRAGPDPYFALSLMAWEQGRFVRFHGLAQWIGWLWPYAAIGWMLSRLALRGR